MALARSMISSPKLLLLDEPLSALDVKLKKVLQAELKRLHRSVGVTFVHVTHDLEEAMMLADRICVMRAGRILQLGEPADIYYRPADRFVAGFIGETNLLPITVTVARCSRYSAIAPRTLPTRLAPSPPTSSPRMLRPATGADDGPPGTYPKLLEAGDAGRLHAAMRPSPKYSPRAERCNTARARQEGQELVIEIQGTSTAADAIGDRVRLGWAKKDIWVFAAGPGHDRAGPADQALA